ncbi:MAG: SUMF1/EgtB/PvdO family nonheme iron enzyme [Elusimicrobia bacterium]|nr:SUMF1/EgtB/PvdO family nonheme iron enzyme [Elusimicrobiota bacterium]
MGHNAVVTTAAGLFLLTIAPGPSRASDVEEFMAEAAARPAPEAPDGILPAAALEWVSIPGGTYALGAENGRDDAKPIPGKTYAIAAFEMSRTAVTIAQYRQCVARSACTRPDELGDCNWGKAGRDNHPVNCVDWNQANDYAKFMGARLPSESEWEYAARGGGKGRAYPWGDEEPSCRRAVMFDGSGAGCGRKGTMPVCSKIAGNTAQGLCDMAGNVWQWVRDTYQNSYAATPADGGAFEGAGSNRVMRGGSFYTKEPGALRVSFRGQGNGYDGFRYGNIGFRLARSSR